MILKLTVQYHRHWPITVTHPIEIRIKFAIGITQPALAFLCALSYRINRISLSLICIEKRKWSSHSMTFALAMSRYKRQWERIEIELIRIPFCRSKTGGTVLWQSCQRHSRCLQNVRLRVLRAVFRRKGSNQSPSPSQSPPEIDISRWQSGYLQ